MNINNKNAQHFYNCANELMGFGSEKLDFVKFNRRIDEYANDFEIESSEFVATLAIIILSKKNKNVFEFIFDEFSLKRIDANKLSLLVNNLDLNDFEKYKLNIVKNSI